VGKISFICEEPGGERIEISTHSEIDMAALFQIMRQFALAIGFSPKTVEEYIDEV